jgi:four helix bundle protein
LAIFTEGSSLTPDDLEKRAKAFALRVVKLVDALPKSAAGRAFGNQLIRSASSVAANYRAARRGRSGKEFVSKLSIVTEEADESTFWLEMIVQAELLPPPKVQALLDEANELMRIFAASRKTAAAGLKRSPNHSRIRSICAPKPCSVTSICS